jgi:hypothetical protein
MKVIDKFNKLSVAVPDMGDAQYLLEFHPEYDHLV